MHCSPKVEGSSGRSCCFVIEATIDRALKKILSSTPLHYPLDTATACLRVPTEHTLSSLLFLSSAIYKCYAVRPLSRLAGSRPPCPRQYASRLLPLRSGVGRAEAVDLAARTCAHKRERRCNVLRSMLFMQYASQTLEVRPRTRAVGFEPPRRAWSRRGRPTP